MERQYYVISLNVKGEPKKYFSIHGGYSRSLKDAVSYEDYNVANTQFEILCKANTSVANYGKVEERTSVSYIPKGDGFCSCC